MATHQDVAGDTNMTNHSQKNETERKRAGFFLGLFAKLRFARIVNSVMDSRAKWLHKIATKHIYQRFSQEVELRYILNEL